MGYFIYQKEVKKGKENIDKKTAVSTETPVKSNEIRTGSNRESFDVQQNEESHIPDDEVSQEENKEEESTNPYAWVKNEEIPIFSHQPGEEINIENYVQKGKTTIFDFYSPYCGPCRRMSPLLERLDSTRDDIVVFKVDINRESVRGIDWRSPFPGIVNLSINQEELKKKECRLYHQKRWGKSAGSVFGTCSYF